MVVQVPFAASLASAHELLPVHAPLRLPGRHPGQKLRLAVPVRPPRTEGEGRLRLPDARHGSPAHVSRHAGHSVVLRSAVYAALAAMAAVPCRRGGHGGAVAVRAAIRGSHVPHSGCARRDVARPPLPIPLHARRNKDAVLFSGTLFTGTVLVQSLPSSILKS